MDDEKPRIVMKAIIEILGAPKEHIEETLKDYLEKLKEDNEVRHIEMDEAKKQGELFAAFAEVEVAFEKPTDILDFCFESMPSSVEILEPSELRFPISEVTLFLNDMQARLHENDMLVKNVQSGKKVLDQNVVNIFRNFIKYMVKQGESEIKKISETLGVTERDLKPFLDKMIEENILTVKEGKYSLKNESKTEN